MTWDMTASDLTASVAASMSLLVLGIVQVAAPVCVCVFVCFCVFVCVNVCKYTHTSFVYKYVCMFVYIRIYVCTYIRM